MKIPIGPIAQMNYGKMIYPLDHSKMKEFSDSLDEVYRLAEKNPDFIWRIPDDQIAREIIENGFSELTSATVSVWNSYEALKQYTYGGSHGEYFERRSEWFTKIASPQLVIWTVSAGEHPSFKVALERLQHLKDYGNTDTAFGWLD